MCPHSASPKTRLLSVGDVLNVIRPYLPFIRGLTVSGGECGLQAPFMTALVRRAREVHQLGTLIDTNGSTDYNQLPELVNMAEGFMLDVKAWDANEHERLTGASNSMVLHNLDFLARIGKLYEVRTVVVPGQFNAEQTVREVSRVLLRYASRTRYKIIGFRPQGVRPQFRKLPQPERAYLEELAEMARSLGIQDVLVV